MSLLESSTIEPITARRQFGLQQVMWMVVSVAVVLAIGTQGGVAGAMLAAALGIVLAVAWWSWWLRSSMPMWLSLFAVPVLHALLVPTLGIPAHVARQMQCKNNIHQLVLALNIYEARYGQFPPAYIANENGKPMHSWRVLILPYIGRDDLYQQYRFDEPWDSPHNLTIAQQIPEEFQCPSRSETTRGLFTSFVAVVGDETMWPSAQPMSIRDIADGTSNTLCLIEWPESDVVWTEPRDFDSDRHWLLTNPPAPLLESKSRHHNGIHVAFADGHVEFISFHKLPGHTVRALFSRAGNDDASWRD